MKTLLAVIVLLSFAAPARAQMPSGFEPVEKPLIEKQRQEEELSRQMQKPQAESAKQEESGSNWWKWGLGILVVGGIAAAAGGGGGGGGSSSTSTNGTINVGW